MTSKKIIITGPPRCGKSTLILKLKDYFFKKHYIIHGFLTPEVKKNGSRIGFDILDIATGEIVEPLARMGNYKTQYMVGKYHLFIDKFEKFLTKLENFEKMEINLIIIDEIGKMELLSEKFQMLIKKMFSSNISIIATIGEKIQHSIKNDIFSLQNITFFNLKRNNQEEIFQKIIKIINY